ncbi:MAG: acetate kinase [Acholeplasmataceae bacterium]|jgi:acetate kinase|nr:acetate kinase [Acholeplasmataceae bacterium]
MKIIAVNAGSSSLKFQLFEMPSEEVITKGLVERIGSNKAVFTIEVDGEKVVTKTPIKDHKVAVSMLFEALSKHKIIKDLEEIKGVGHRVVQGGEKFLESTLITDEVVEEVRKLNPLAPLHNPANIIGIESFRKALPNVKQVAVFDTTFHTTMPRENFMYATPYEWYEKYGVRKYGFHGTSHQYVSERAIELLGREESKIIVLHLGNGASLSAVLNGKSIDTTMGLTPLEGIPMGTRSGNIDPAILGLVQQEENLSLTELLEVLNKKSGYLGVSGKYTDNRDIVAEMNNGCDRCKLALDIQIKRIVDYIGSYYVLMGGLDALVFTAGIGENSWEVRELICNKLEVLGVKLSEKKNKTRGLEEINCCESKVKVYAIKTDEEVMIAREVLRVK